MDDTKQIEELVASGRWCVVLETKDGKKLLSDFDYKSLALEEAEEIPNSENAVVKVVGRRDIAMNEVPAIQTPW